ncbi:MAG: glycosyltransferase family 2 protein [Maribacter sp.]
MRTMVKDRFSFQLNVMMLLILMVLLLLLPKFVIWMLAFFAAMTIVLELIRIFLWVPSEIPASATTRYEEPFVSVHLAIHNECPEMVIQTIQTIVSQDYPNFELIVIDNNTKSTKKWKIVEQFCLDMKNVRFYHLKNWPHYKAGALNFSRRISHRDSKYVFVVDADYQLNPNALKKAVKGINGNNVALVQFPQSYHLEVRHHLPILADFEHFFKLYCVRANGCLGALATGTLSLIDITALDAIGGWPTVSITEDAELGVRLQSAGYHIKYQNETIGKGIAPIHQQDFIKQRKRWIFGNAQTLMKYPIDPFYNFPKFISGIAQLTAWSNLLGVPILAIVASILLSSIIPTDISQVVLTISVSAFWFVIFGKLIQLIWVNGAAFSTIFGSLLIYLTSVSVGAFYWWPAILGKKRPFVTTDKTSKPGGYEYNLAFQVLFVVLALIAFEKENLFVAYSSGILGFMFLVSGLFDCYCRTGSLMHFKLKLVL